MDLYTKTSYELAEVLTKRYSTSFSMSSRLFDESIRRHIYAIYGMVRIADEVVDTFRGEDAPKRLEHFSVEVANCLNDDYSLNPILQAFGHTAKRFSIGPELIQPFFDSMQVDLTKTTFSQQDYETYIYGSAEVVGLMCLRVFVNGDDVAYDALKKGAMKLGAAYQKVNFLRDIASDYQSLGRLYFPEVSFDEFSEETKQAIVSDIHQDFAVADKTIDLLPDNSRRAVRMSYRYYMSLLDRLSAAPVDLIKQKRIRVPDMQKISMLILTQVGR